MNISFIMKVIMTFIVFQCKKKAGADDDDEPQEVDGIYVDDE